MDLSNRRQMLLAIFGGENVSVGGLTKYQKLTATCGENGMYLDFTHSLGKKPKFILVKPGENETVSTDKLEYFVGDDYIAIAQITNGTTGNKSRYSLAARSTKADTATSNGTYWFDDTEGRLRQYSNNAKWQYGITYDIELWA